jgi:hypothetical protein
MYVGVKSVYSNYHDFKRLVGGAMKMSRACFGNFECILCLAKVNDRNCSR